MEVVAEKKGSEKKGLRLNNLHSTGDGRGNNEKAVKSASSYPNEIRYGEAISHFPLELVLKMAKTILAWAKENMGTIRKVAES